MSENEPSISPNHEPNENLILKENEPETPTDNVNEIVPEPVEKSPSPEPAESNEKNPSIEPVKTPDLEPTPQNDRPESPVPEPKLDERDPHDIEEEIQKVTLAGYTENSELKHEIVQNLTSNVFHTNSEDIQQNIQKNETISKESSSSEKKPTNVTKQLNKPIATKLTTPSKATTVKPQTKEPTSAGSKRILSTPSNLQKKTLQTPAISSTPKKPLSNLTQKPPEKQKMPISSGSRTHSTTRTVTKSTPPVSKPGTATSQTGKVLPETPKLSKKYENVKGKINSLSDHKPTGGNVKIFHDKPKFNVTSKIGSLENAKHVPGGGQVKIESRKINFKENAKPKIDAKAEIKTTNGEKKILSQKLEWKAESKIGSLANVNHKPAGGEVKIFDQKIKVDAKPKIGSLENATHQPTGGNVKISEYKVTTKSSTANSVTSSTNSRRSSTNAARNKMPGCKDPITAEQVLENN